EILTVTGVQTCALPIWSTPSGVAIVNRSSYSITTTVERFTGSRSADWRELELLVSEAGRRPERLGAERVLRLGALYRAAAADLRSEERRVGKECRSGSW